MKPMGAFTRPMAASRSIDLHLLACFDALITERSVTRAAERVGLTQPAMSNALGRMRELFGDALLVRTTKGMAPTPRALELQATVRPALLALTQAFEEPEAFDPGAARLAFTLAVTDYTSSIVVPQLVTALRREAPGIELIVVPPDRARVREWLENGDIDLTLGYYVDLAEGLRAIELFRDSMCCIAAARHPLVRGSIDLATYMAAGHAYWGGANAHLFTMEMVTDRALERLGLQRKVALRTSSAAVLAQTVAATDLIGTMARAGAEQYSRQFALQTLGVPFGLEASSVSMVWHERTHRSPGARWLREVIRRLDYPVVPASDGSAKAS